MYRCAIRFHVSPNMLFRNGPACMILHFSRHYIVLDVRVRIGCELPTIGVCRLLRAPPLYFCSITESSSESSRRFVLPGYLESFLCSVDRETKKVVAEQLLYSSVEFAACLFYFLESKLDQLLSALQHPDVLDDGVHSYPLIFVFVSLSFFKSLFFYFLQKSAKLRNRIVWPKDCSSSFSFFGSFRF